MRLTLRTLLAYLDDTLPPDQAKMIGQKVAESETAQELIDRLKRVSRRRGLSTPGAEVGGTSSDPNKVAEYLSDALPSEEISQFEKLCLDSDVYLAEVTACHQILTLLLSEPVRVPPTARMRMYQLVKGRESLPKRKPGNTIPVGGIPPQEDQPGVDEADATFLMGLSPFSKGQTWKTVLVPLTLLASLVGVTWIAWPSGMDDPHRGSPTTVVMLPVPAPEPNEKAKVPAVVDPNTGKKAEEKPVEPKVKPVEVKPALIPLVPEVPEPRLDRISIGKLDNTDAVLLTQREGQWLRVMKTEPTITSAERLLSLPGYKSKLMLDSGVNVELWGNMPEQLYSTILESSVTLHVPAEGFDAEITAKNGRFYISSKKPAPAKIRLRILKEIWDITLPNDKSEVVVEVSHGLVRGMLDEHDDKELPLAAVQLAVLKGSCSLSVRYKEIPQMVAGQSVVWTNKGAGLVGPKQMGPESAYLSKFPVLADENIAKALQQALNEFSTSFTKADLVRVKLGELLDDSAMPTLLNYTKARIGLLGSAAIADLPTLVDSLIDTKRPFMRDAAIYGLMEVVPAMPEGVVEFRNLLMSKCGLTEPLAKRAIRLLRGPTDAERLDPAVVDGLIDALDPKVDPVLREMSYWLLKNDIDPESRTVLSLARLDINGPAEQIDSARTLWKRRIDELRKKAETKAGEPKPSDPK